MNGWVRSLFDFFYYRVIVRMSWWPIGLTRIREPARADEPRVAYYLWHFPTLSQTFVCREMVSVRASGVHLEIVADAAEENVGNEPEMAAFRGVTHYLEPADPTTLRRYRWRCFSRHPLTFINLIVYVMTRRYGRFKHAAEDLAVFGKAVHLAGVLAERGITHVHAPWADRCAFLALLASRLLHVSYSVQGRAHDIHRDAYVVGLAARMEGACQIITNSEYNRTHLCDELPEKAAFVNVIYNGVDLAELVPPEERRQSGNELRILCVARLIEQKGLVHLLGACRRLLDDGTPIRCDIVGGPELPLYINYWLKLRKLHHRLALEDTVIFHGPQPFSAVLNFYRNADAFVLPCVIAADGSRDVTPNALIEAMAMELPIVSTTVTAIPEIVEHGVSGLLVPPHDESALVAALAELAAEPAARRRLGRNARTQIARRFDPKRSGRRYAELFRYGSLCGASSPSATGQS